MSWLNNSLNSIKGQLTTLAQEVLAETAGPGDEEYVARPMDAKVAQEVLSETQKECDQLNKICSEKDNEIATLRKQIIELQNKISYSSGGNATATPNSGRPSKLATTEPNVATLEDSWCWEPENVKSDNDHSSETSSANGAEMVTISLEEEVPLEGETGRGKKRRAQRQSPEHTVELQGRIQQLEEENKQLNTSIEELDAQHNLAMQNVLELKKNLQDKLSAVNKDYAALKKEHADKFINGELELERVKKQLEEFRQETKAVEIIKAELQRKSEDYAAELKQAMIELADAQALLDKKNKDNVELIERIKEANKVNEKAEEQRNELLEQVERLHKEIEELKVSKEKKHSESSGGSSGKQSDDEFILVRDGDATSSTPSTPPTKEELKDKIVQLENKLSELTLENGSLSLKLQDSEMEKQLSANVMKEQLLELQQKYDEKDTVLIALNEELAEQREKVMQFKEQAADAIIANEKLKLLTDEKESTQAEISKMKDQLARSEELEKRLLISEQEKEVLQLELHTLRLESERVQILEQKLQSLTLEHQQLKLNTVADKEVLNNSTELEEKLRVAVEENESIRAQLDGLAERKFVVEKKKVTDLDADEEDESTTIAFDFDKLKELLIQYHRQALEKPENVEVSTNEMAEKTFKALRERLCQIDALEKNLAQLTEELLDLQDNKLVWDHEKKTLEADISQYILQCDELMKNNEILLNELDNYKRNKLETIPEHNEENVLQLESQLEECTKLNRTLEEEYSELNEKIDELERGNQELTEKLREAQTENIQLKAQERDFQLQIETAELEKCNLQFELNEFKSNEERNGEANVSLQLAEDKCNSLENQLQRLSKDHADLVAAMQAQKASLLEAHKKREELEKLLSEQEMMASKHRQAIAETESQQGTYEKALEELMLQLKTKEEELLRQRKEQTQTSELSKQVVELQQALQAKNIVADELKSQLVALQVGIAARQEELNALSESNKELQSQYAELQQQLSLLQSELQNRETLTEKLQAELTSLRAQSKQSTEFETLQAAKEALAAEHQKLQQLFEAQTVELNALQATSASSSQLPDPDSVARIAKLEGELLATADLQKSIDSLNFEKNEMIKALQQKHAENMQYYMEIQRLQPIIQQLQQQLATAESTVKPCIKCPDLESRLDEMRKEHEKLLDQINFLKEKSDILTTNLLTEQTNQKLIQQEKVEMMEKNALVQKDLERLREHLLEVEQMHTQESMEMQREVDETKAKMIAMQEEVSKSSTAYTSASIRANQHAETLQAQYALVVQQRDELVAKLSLAEDRELKNQAALCNLQCALEQFQNDKENDIKTATLRIRKELQQELDKEEQLRAEIATLNQQLNDANQGLRAASRLSDQLEASQLTIATLREEVETLRTQYVAVQQKLQYSESSQTDKIDKNLIKSLLIGYVVCGNPNDKAQVLRMISSVLNFTQNESDKVGLNKQQSSWFGAILGSGGVAGGHSKDNLVQAFVEFLEQESQPKDKANNMPNLLNITQTAAATSSSSASGSLSRKTSISSNSGGLNVAPPNVVDDFTPSRNSSSILKDILSDT